MIKYIKFAGHNNYKGVLFCLKNKMKMLSKTALRSLILKPVPLPLRKTVILFIA